MTDTAVRIRPARLSDVEEIAQLMDDVIRWLVERGRSGQWGATPMSSSSDFVGRVEALVDLGHVRTAWRGADLVGVLVTGPDPPGYVPAGLIPDDALYVVQVTTARGGQGRGVGRLLMDEVDAIARRSGLGFAALDHWGGSPELARVYERAGYEQVGAFTIEQRGEPWPGVVRLRQVPAPVHGGSRPAPG